MTDASTETATTYGSSTGSSNRRYDCPRCGQHTHRVHRRLHERIFSLIVPMRRYRCSHCGWSGLVRKGQQRANLEPKPRVTSV